MITRIEIINCLHHHCYKSKSVRLSDIEAIKLHPFCGKITVLVHKNNVNYTLYAFNNNPITLVTTSKFFMGIVSSISDVEMAIAYCESAFETLITEAMFA